METPSLTGAGAPSTKSFASFRPRPVTSRTALITPTFLSPKPVRTTSNSVCSSAAAPASPPAAAGAAATAAAAVTPNFSSMASISSTRSITLISATALRISSLETAIFNLLNHRTGDHDWIG
ncbi:50S ribosomal protein L7/L12 [Alcanivorax balearicus MACL04]|uniref:50S ribosomal protein L7/L12 n=1 Tax=Alloalcanivorax balearicus MACL04 TaxID=1177182 RepID=A0ABT2R514_9GAMM|nr:50S ribosomal protein L7/L12 [Alloalcanivorax balearicus MACL04]